MRRYRVVSLAVGGNCNKLYKQGDIVKESNFPPGNAELNVLKGHLVRHPDRDLQPNEKPRVGVLTCIWKRHELFKKFAAHWAEIQEGNKDVDFVFVAVGSEGKESKKAAKGTVFDYYEYPNKPVSDKWNYGCKIFENLQVDNIIFLGSDDFICQNVFSHLYQKCREGFDCVGLLDCYLFDSISKDFVYFSGYGGRRSNQSVGIARCLSSCVLSRLGYTPWRSNLNSRLDSSMSQKLTKINYSNYTFRCKDVDGVAVDVKTNCNITPFQSELPKHSSKLLTKINSLHGYL